MRPLNSISSRKMDMIMMHLAQGRPIIPRTLTMWGRQMVIGETCGKVAKTNFQHLCGESRSAAEYLEITKNFDTLLLEEIPRMSLTTRNEARRFITLIDALYDSKVKLVASFEASLSELFNGDTAMRPELRLVADLEIVDVESPIFTGEEEVFAFKRALSRLMEMRGVEWVGTDITSFIKTTFH